MRLPGRSVGDRLAAAPISWGVCEVPGWGVMLPRERVLKEMAALGLRASELGAIGYLGEDGAEIASLLAGFGLAALGGFVPLSLHDPSATDVATDCAERAAKLIASAGGRFFVTAVVVDAAWSAPFDLDGPGWDVVARGIAIVERICAVHGLTQVIHPHVGTLVETEQHVRALMDRSPVSWCLDTGHFAIGGLDPVAFAAEHVERIGLAHLKDVDLSLAPAVRSREMGLLDATRAGLFRPLGRGDVDVAAVVRVLESKGYRGWYVLEQDTTIAERDAVDADPAADVKASLDYLAEELGKRS